MRKRRRDTYTGTFNISKMNFGGYQSVGSSYGGGRGYQGGGSYDTFGGGGYMANEMGGGFTSPGGTTGTPGGKDSKRGGFKNQATRPVTAAMLHRVTSPPGAEEIYLIDDEQVNQIVLVGEIVEVFESATSVMYKIDDRTGPPVEVRRWINAEEDSQFELERRAACREGIYVKIVGHIKMFNNQRTITGFMIRPIEDFNEVTHHMAETMFAHLAITKGLKLPEQFSDHQQGNQMGGASSFGSTTPQAGGSGWTPLATSTQMSGTSYGNQFNSGLTLVQQKVLSVIGNTKGDHGLHVNDIISSVKTQGFSDASIKTALDFLSNEGHVYSTIDEQHFKSTEDV
ncbi:PREDICTED: replication protein A 32 kDa subunit-B-like isoform X2 [Amphimedon queenslandica]|uniref:Replication protein A C-terminal domain-containing protein n=1 Tax=Amphimedon queenslandica TaxID=400682 RepID=A0AAN0JP95_AMPQE|nr:PREDICTED: replication protein A 32 kDa subunit-B-like isoform X2 [Amphimedon queenslandica]|eukprot:XP_019858654.1 PREDICTED: replication protein A 32 kDa subunit-B-like isoform X2 [Amphimedon queenslandica]